MSAVAREWFIVSTHSKFEEGVKEALMHRAKAYGLSDKFGDILIPTEKVVEMRGGKRVVTTKQVYPGYVLVNMELNPDTWQMVKNTDKAMGFVPPHKPQPMDEDDVARIRTQMEDASERPKLRHTFEAGESVRIIHGPFSSFHGVVDEVQQDRNRLKVMVTIFGRSTPVELEFLEVEKI